MAENVHSGTVSAIGTRSIPAGRSSKLEAQRVLSDKVSYTIDRAEATIRIAVPAGIKGRDIHWRATATSISLGLVGQKPLVEGELWGRVREDECHWQFDEAEVCTHESICPRSTTLLNL